MKPVLIDTGFIVAMLDKRESHHKQCMEFFEECVSPLVTCEAVITESMYLLRKQRGAAWAILVNIEREIFSVAPIIEKGTPRIRTLMSKYESVPISFADASLIYLAESFKTSDIATLDSDFSIYRWNNTRKFQNVIL
jgi:predicted nucleic acid-binding protein